MRTEGFSCSLDILYEVFENRINKLQINGIFQVVGTTLKYDHQNPGFGFNLSKKLDPDRIENNAGPQYCEYHGLI